MKDDILFFGFLCLLILISFVMYLRDEVKYYKELSIKQNDCIKSLNEILQLSKEIEKLTEENCKEKDKCIADQDEIIRLYREIVEELEGGIK